jgi:nucleotide-binding universal stress UspA family protein
VTYLVGYSPFKDDSCALQLACELARSQGEDVHALTVVPRGWEATHSVQHDKDFVDWARAQGEASAAEALELLGRHPDVSGSASWITARSVPAAMLEQAEKLGATLLVVGSGVHGSVGRVSVTSKTDRLAHSSTIPVAIAPRGYRPAPEARISRVTVAFRDDDAAWRLVDRVADICRRTNGRLRLVTFTIRRRPMVQAGVSHAEDIVDEQLTSNAEAAQREATEHLLSTGFPASELDAVVAPGRTWEDAMDSVPWAAGDLLVVGSSSTHQLATVFVGSSAAKILRASPVPTIVFP